MPPVGKSRGFRGCYDDAAASEMINENNNANINDNQDKVNVSVVVNNDDGDGNGGGNGDGEKVTICHEGQTIEVDMSALPAHYEHGDTLGPCPETVIPAAEPLVAEEPVVDLPIEEPVPEDTVANLPVEEPVEEPQT